MRTNSSNNQQRTSSTPNPSNNQKETSSKPKLRTKSAPIGFFSYFFPKKPVRWWHEDICLKDKFFNETDVFNWVKPDSFPRFFYRYIRDNSYYKKFFHNSLAARFFLVNSKFHVFKNIKIPIPVSNNKFFWDWKLSTWHNYNLVIDFPVLFKRTDVEIVEIIALIIQRIKREKICAFKDFTCTYVYCKKNDLPCFSFIVNLSKKYYVFPRYEAYKLVRHLIYFTFIYWTVDMGKSLPPVDRYIYVSVHTSFQSMEFTFIADCFKRANPPFYFCIVPIIKEIPHVSVNEKIRFIKYICAELGYHKAAILTGTSRFLGRYWGLPILHYFGEFLVYLSKNKRFLSSCIVLSLYFLVLLTVVVFFIVACVIYGV